MPGLRDSIRKQKFESRLALAELIAAAEPGVDQTREARAFLQQLAMHRVFDRFSEADEAELVQIVAPILEPSDGGGQRFLFPMHKTAELLAATSSGVGEGSDDA